MALEGFSINELRTRITDAGAEWEAGETQFTEMSSIERSLYLGYIPGPGEPSLEEREQIAQANLEVFLAAGTAAGFPSSYDLRNVNGQNFITPVKDQGGCGSCVAFGVAATAEGRFRIQRNNPNLEVDFSEAHLFFCNGRQCKKGDPNYGWSASAGLTFFRDQGVVDDACYPYQGINQACKLCTDWQGRLRKITGWKQISSAGEMKEWISTQGPLVACYTVYDDFFAYTGGIYKHLTGGVAGGHCISVVGYNDAQQYWICKNSWGKTSGEENPYDPQTPKEKGYFRIAYGQCGIDSVMYTVDAVAETGWERNQRVVGLWTINEDRNAWVYVQGMGWRKISPDNDNIFFDMLTQLIAAKGGNRPVDFRQEGSVIKEIYVF
jgi:C1A family cysteine protease